MDAWDKSWKHGHLPMWMKKSVRQASKIHSAKDLGLEIGYRSGISIYGGLWDHWGSVRRGEEVAVITQPYNRDDAAAEQFAERVGCKVDVVVPGPWEPRTVMYVFTPNK